MFDDDDDDVMLFELWWMMFLFVLDVNVCVLVMCGMRCVRRRRGGDIARARRSDARDAARRELYWCVDDDKLLLICLCLGVG